MIALHHGVGILYTRCHLLSDFFTPLKIPRFVVVSDFFTPGDEPTGETPHCGKTGPGLKPGKPEGREGFKII